MSVNNTRRKKKRRPTMNGRFSTSTLALEIGLVRLTLGMQKEIEKREEEDKNSR